MTLPLNEPRSSVRVQQFKNQMSLGVTRRLDDVLHCYDSGGLKTKTWPIPSHFSK